MNGDEHGEDCCSFRDDGKVQGISAGVRGDEMREESLRNIRASKLICKKIYIRVYVYTYIDEAAKRNPRREKELLQGFCRDAEATA